MKNTQISKLALVLISVSALSLGGCRSTGQTSAEDGMDIALTKLPVHETEAKAKVEQSEGLVIPADAKIDWQQFFKASPNREQRSAIEKLLETPKASESLADLLKRGRNEVALGRFVAAEATFREALRQNEGDKDLLQELAQLYLRKRELNRAFEFLAELKESLEDSPQKNSVDIFRYRYTLAMAYLERNELAKGHKVLSDLIALDKTFTPGYAALAASYLKRGKYNVAEFIAKRGLDRSKEDASLYNTLGLVAKNAGQETNAKEYFSKAIAISPTYTPALVNRANMMMEIREFDAAEAELKQAIAFSPSNSSAYITLGLCQKKMGRNDAALSSFNKAIELDPENGSARFNLAILMADQYKKPNQALRLFHEVLQARSSDEETKELARLYIDDIREIPEP